MGGYIVSPCLENVLHYKIEMCLKYLRNMGSFIQNQSLTSIGMAFSPSLDLGLSPNNSSFPDRLPVVVSCNNTDSDPLHIRTS